MRPSLLSSVIALSLVATLFVACKREPLPPTEAEVAAAPAVAVPPEAVAQPQAAAPVEAAAPAAVVPAAAPSAAPVLEGWTVKTLDVKREVPPSAVLKNVRSAKNDGFDRVVFEYEGERLPGYHVEYVDKPVVQCGSGNPVEVLGDGLLLVRMSLAQAHTEEGQPTVKDSKAKVGLPNLQVLRMVCDFEGQVEYVLGLSSPKPFRVLELKSPSRLVVDVKH